MHAFLFFLKFTLCKSHFNLKESKENGLWLTFYFDFFFQYLEKVLKLHWERWKVRISEQYLQCLVQSVYKLTFSIVVFYRLGPWSIRQVLGVWVVYGSGPLKNSDIPCVDSFVGLWSAVILVNFLSCTGFTAWGIGAVDKKEYCQIFLSFTCL